MNERHPKSIAGRGGHCPRRHGFGLWHHASAQRGGGRANSLRGAGRVIHHAEILREALSHKPGWHLRRDLIVRIGDHEIPERNWERVRVKKGAVVTFRPRLQGGGNVLRTVLSLVLAVAAIAFAGPLAGTLFAAGTVAFSVASAAISTGIILAGTLALNALFPVAKPKEAAAGESSTALNSIQGAQNQANPFGPIPVVLGRHRQSPYFAAKPYTEIVGDDQYLRLLFCLGYGPLNIESLQIGETALSSFTDYQSRNSAGAVRRHAGYALSQRGRRDGAVDHARQPERSPKASMSTAATGTAKRALPISTNTRSISRPRKASTRSIQKPATSAISTSPSRSGTARSER
jgi:predicted phage tail protein